MTSQPDSATQLAALTAAPSTATIAGVWAAVPVEDQRRALAVAIRSDPEMRQALIGLLKKTPRFKSFRPTSFKSWSSEQFADVLKTPAMMSVDVMQAGLIALHINERSEMLSAFLDSLGIPHEKGLITDGPEKLAASEAELHTAADDLAARFPRAEVLLYFLTLLVLEPELWGGLAGWLERQGAAASRA